MSTLRISATRNASIASKKLMVIQLTAAFQAGAVVKVMAFGTSAKAGMNRLSSVVGGEDDDGQRQVGIALARNCRLAS